MRARRRRAHHRVVYDVLVAGGGPAGLAAAAAAAASGAGVVVCERENAFGIPTRTSGGSFIADLRTLGIPPALYNPIDRVHFIGPTSSATFDYPEPVVAVLDVRALYQWLAERAAAAGAELRLRSTVMGADRVAGGVRVRLRGPGGEDCVEARRAIDATGTAAVLAVSVGMHPPFARRGVGAEVDLAAPAFPATTCYLLVGGRVAPSGYAWAFPYRPGRVRVGTGIIRPDSGSDPRRLLDAVLDTPALRDAVAGSQPIERHAGLIPAEPLRRCIVSGGVVCIGDAASHASTLMGEGIRYAIAAGRAAGLAAAVSARAGDDVALREFERSWSANHRRDFAIAYRINRATAGFDDARWDRAVGALRRTPPWFVARVLSTRFRARDVVRLAVTRPVLAGRYVRAAL